MTPEAMAASKALRRGIAKAHRQTLLPRRAEAGRRMARIGLAEIRSHWVRDAVVAGYFPKHDEFDLLPLLQAFKAMGYRVVLPVVAAPGQPLIFRHWRQAEPLVPGVMGIGTPPETSPELRPDIVLVPFLEVDRNGFRLGYGGGYYDRTLAALRLAGEVLAIGAGFYGQIVDHVPHDEHDARLDAILTERGLVFMADATPGRLT